MRQLAVAVFALVFSMGAMAEYDNGYDDEPENGGTTINVNAYGGEGGEAYAEGGSAEAYAEGGSVYSSNEMFSLDFQHQGQANYGLGTGNTTEVRVEGDKVTYERARPPAISPDLTADGCTGSKTLALGGVLSGGSTNETVGCATWRNVKQMRATPEVAWTANSYNAVLCGYGKMKPAMEWAGVDCKAVLAGPKFVQAQVAQEDDESTWAVSKPTRDQR